MRKLILLFIVVCCFSCQKQSRFTIDTNKNAVNVRIARVDKDIIGLEPSDMYAEVSRLYKTYPEFMEIFVTQIMGADRSDTTAVVALFSDFLADSTFSDVNAKTLEVFDNIADIEKSVSVAFTYLKHYFPQLPLPQVYFYVSGFNQAIVLENDYVGVGVDLYLGSDYPDYQNFAYQYMTQNMTRQHVAADLVSAYVFKTFRNESNESRLIDHMLYRGKLMYLLSVVMPNEKPEILMGYSKEQWNWSVKHEKEIWSTMIDQKDLFSTDFHLIRKYVNDAPFTTPISQESPGRLATWIGWRIVESYMNRNVDVSLVDLVNEHNYLKILESSGYKPR